VSSKIEQGPTRGPARNGTRKPQESAEVVESPAYMPPTVNEEIVIRAMRAMTPQQQRAVVQFAARVAKKQSRTKGQEHLKKSGTSSSDTPRNVRKLVKSNRLKGNAEFASGVANDTIRPQKTKPSLLKNESSSLKNGSSSRSSDAQMPPSICPDLRQKEGTRGMTKNGWLFSENRNREASPLSNPSGQEWRLNRFNHRP
jgi:hypothetical protein